jgi:hypothetical protein
MGYEFHELGRQQTPELVTKRKILEGDHSEARVGPSFDVGRVGPLSGPKDIFLFFSISEYLYYFDLSSKSEGSTLLSPELSE